MLAAGGRDEGRSLPPCRYPGGAEAGSGCCSAGGEHPLPAPTLSPGRRCSAPPRPQPRSVPISGRSPAAAAPFPYRASWILPATHRLPSASQPAPAPPGALPGHKPHRMPPRPSLPLTNNPELPAASLVLRGQQETEPLLFASPQTKPRHSPATNRAPPTTPTAPAPQPHRFCPPPRAAHFPGPALPAAGRAQLLSTWQLSAASRGLPNYQTDPPRISGPFGVPLPSLTCITTPCPPSYAACKPPRIPDPPPSSLKKYFPP